MFPSDWQSVAVLVIVSVTVALLIRRAYRRTSGCHCSDTSPTEKTPLPKTKRR